MKVTEASYVRYDLPLKRPWSTIESSVTVRPGFLLRLRDETGRVAWGDAATFPAPRGEGLAPIERDVGRLVESVHRSPVELDPEPPGAELGLHRAARAAWVQATLTLEALEKGVPLRDLLAARLPRSGRRSRVTVNATLPVGPEADTVARARGAVADGYSCLKLKVGSQLRELRRIAAVRKAVGPSITLRVDPNGSWDELELERYLAELAPLDLDYIEQPLPPGRVLGLKKLGRKRPIPIAIDESAHNLAQVEALVAKGFVDVIVVKPLALGGLDRALQLIQTARAASLRIVVTDSVESAIGRTAALHLAAALPSGTGPCGVGSGEWFDRDISPDAPRVRQGTLKLPPGPGLGIEPAKAPS